MRIKHIFLYIQLIAIFSLGIAGAVHAGTGQVPYTTSYPEHYTYYSGHHWNTALAECSAALCTSADTYCDKDTINCPVDRPYKRSWTVNSFRVAMGYLPYFDEGDGIYTYSGAGRFVQWGLISDSQIRRLRVYVPKGATSYTVVLAGSQAAYGVVVRWKQIPEGTYINAITNDPNNLNYYDIDGYVSLETFAARDVYFANPGGTLGIINGGLAQPVEEGGWLYIYFFYTPGGSVPISEAVIRFKVNKEMFYAWYDDIEAAGLWDTENEPPPKEGAVPDSTPTPTDITAIKSSTTCEAVGGYWCNGACQAAACATPGACTTQATCANSNFFWCADTCQAAACITSPPTDAALTVTYQDNTATASWQASNAEGYILYWALSGSDGTPDMNTLGYADMERETSISAATSDSVRLFIAIQAYNQFGYSGVSNIVQIPDDSAM